jgi:transposase, IS5 family
MGFLVNFVILMKPQPHNLFKPFVLYLDRNHPLTEEQKETNRVKSTVRAKVEHVFGTWVMNLGGKLVRCIGLERVTSQLGLKDLAYNLRRYVFWCKKEEQTLQNQCV